MKVSKLKSIIQEVLQELNELSATGGGAGFTPGQGAQYATPKAFDKKKRVSKVTKNIKNTLKEVGFRGKITFDDIRPGSKLSNKFKSGKTYIVVSSDSKSATIENVATGYVIRLYSLANYSLV